MYRWYQDSQVCYVFLEDVPPLGPWFPETEFKRARWFKRGWCLQELIAPLNIEFYALDWTEIGTKWSLHGRIEQATGIPSDVLLKRTSLNAYPIAQRMSWASERETTRREDETYCLLGIFEISMPLLYGEGERAFLRLQEEIMKRTEDYSLLLWTEDWKRHPLDPSLGVFASSPKLFSREGLSFSTGWHFGYEKIKVKVLDYRQRSIESQWNPPQMTSRGLRLQAFTDETTLERESTSAPIITPLLLWTGCTFGSRYICIALHKYGNGGVSKYSRSKFHEVQLVDVEEFGAFMPYELYLNIDPHSRLTMQGLSERNNSSRHISVILSTRDVDEISFIEAIPRESDYTIRPWAKGLDIFGSSITDGLLSLRFLAKNSQFGTGPGVFTVDWGAKPVPWCTIRAHSATNSWSSNNSSIQDVFSDKEDAEVHKCYKEQKEVNFSDRATIQLSNGNVVYAAAKGTGPLTHTRYTLHVTLLGVSPFGI